MKRCNPPYHPKKTDNGFVIMDVDRGMVAEGPMSAAKAIEKADEMNQPFMPGAAENPNWQMHRSRLTGMFSRGGKTLRVRENQNGVMTMEQVSNNPELLTVGLNPRKRKKRRLTLKLRNPRRRKGGRRRRRGRNPSVTYRGKRYKGFLALMHKFGKGLARKIWRSKRGKSIGTNPAKRKGKKSNWMTLVKKYGVRGAMKRRRGR